MSPSAEETRCLQSARASEHRLATAFVEIARRHAEDAGISDMMLQLAAWSEGHVQALDEILGALGSLEITVHGRSETLHRALFRGAGSGPARLLHDVEDLSLLATRVRGLWTVLGQAAHARRDKEASARAARFGDQLDRQIAWLETQVKTIAAQALTVPPPVKRPRRLVPRKKSAPVLARVPTDAGR